MASNHEANQNKNDNKNSQGVSETGQSDGISSGLNIGEDPAERHLNLHPIDLFGDTQLNEEISERVDIFDDDEGKKKQ